MEAEPDHITSQYSLYPRSPSNQSSPISAFEEMEHPTPIVNSKLGPYVPGDRVIPYPTKMVASTLTLAPLQVALLDIPNGYIGYEMMVKYIRNHPFRWIMTMQPQAAYRDLICEFWLSCKVKKDQNENAYISGYVLNRSKRVVITHDLIKEVFELGYLRQEDFSPTVSDKEAKAIMVKCDYPQAELDKSSTIRTKHISGIWNLLMGTITRTLQFKIGGFDTPNSTELQIFHAMVTNNKIDFARLILNELIEKVVNKAKSNVVPCARILSVIIERCLNGDYTGATGPTVIIKPIWYTIFSPTKVNQPLLPAMLDALAEEEEVDDDDTLVAAKKKAKAKGKASSTQPDVAPEAEATHAKKGKGMNAHVSEAEAEAEAEAEEETDVENETESDPEITKISSKGVKSVSSSLISSSPKSSKAEGLTKKRKPKSNPTPASQSDPQPPPSKKLKPSPTISPTGTEVLDMLSSFAEGGETAGHLSPPLSLPRIPLPPRKPRTLKLKGKPQAESVQHSKGLPSSALPSKKGSGVLKRTTPHGSTPSFSEQPSSLHKRSG